MRLEHVAFNVSDPAAVADWYVANLGMRLHHAGGPPNNVRYVADDAGMMFEFYGNSKAPVPDYAKQDLLILHLAFHHADPDVEAAKLCTKGATLIGGADLPAGGRIVNLRDPWGLAFQLVRRNSF